MREPEGDEASSTKEYWDRLHAEQEKEANRKLSCYEIERQISVTKQMMYERKPECRAKYEPEIAELEKALAEARAEGRV